MALSASHTTHTKRQGENRKPWRRPNAKKEDGRSLYKRWYESALVMKARCVSKHRSLSLWRNHGQMKLYESLTHRSVLLLTRQSSSQARFSAATDMGEGFARNSRKTAAPMLRLKRCKYEILLCWRKKIISTIRRKNWRLFYNNQRNCYNK